MGPCLYCLSMWEHPLNEKLLALSGKAKLGHIYILHLHHFVVYACREKCFSVVSCKTLYAVSIHYNQPLANQQGFACPSL